MMMPLMRCFRLELIWLLLLILVFLLTPQPITGGERLLIDAAGDCGGYSYGCGFARVLDHF